MALSRGKHNAEMSGEAASLPFEILEHTADIGLRAYGRTLEGLFQNACLGMLEIMGARTEDGRNQEGIVLDMSEKDLGAILVEFLDEVIYCVDRYVARVASVDVRIDGDLLVAAILWGASPDPVEGTELKATTYHQLEVGQESDGWVASVYFDV
jgi:SHS2 domain-containing protein